MSRGTHNDVKWSRFNGYCNTHDVHVLVVVTIKPLSLCHGYNITREMFILIVFSIPLSSQTQCATSQCLSSEENNGDVRCLGRMKAQKVTAK
jgi:hypothetical protein